MVIWYEIHERLVYNYYRNGQMSTPLAYRSRS